MNNYLKYFLIPNLGITSVLHKNALYFSYFIFYIYFNFSILIQKYKNNNIEYILNFSFFF